MRARTLFLAILAAASLVALAGLSWAGAGRLTGYPWTGTGNQCGRHDQHPWQGGGNRDGRWNQPDTADRNRHGHHEGSLNQGDRDTWQGNPPRRVWNDERNDCGREERPKPPWGGPLGEGGHLGW